MSHLRLLNGFTDHETFTDQDVKFWRESAAALRACVKQQERQIAELKAENESLQEVLRRRDETIERLKGEEETCAKN